MNQASKRNTFLLGMGILAMILLVVLDQFTKRLAVLYLKNAPAVPVIPGIFELAYLENRGAAFGILQGQKGFLVVITVVTLSVLIYLYIRIPKEKRYFFMHLLFSGSLG